MTQLQQRCTEDGRTSYQFVIDLVSGFSAEHVSRIEALLAAHAAPSDLAQLRDEVDEVLDALAE